MLRTAIIALAEAALFAFPVTTANATLSASSASTGASGSRVTAAAGSGSSSTIITGDTSSNWSGYVDSVHSFQAISASWTVPTISQSGGAVAQWVGIGGTGNIQGLIQAGVIEDWSNGRAVATAFTENLPASAEMGQTVAAGTKVTASVAPSGTDKWTLSVLADSKTLAQQTVTLAGADAQQVEGSAEWILEAPSSGRGRIEPLAVFTPVTFESATAETASGTLERLGSAGTLDSLVLESSDGLEAQPGSIGANGETFTVTESRMTETPGGGGYGGNGYGGGGYGGGGDGFGGYGGGGYGYGGYSYGGMGFGGW